MSLPKRPPLNNPIPNADIPNVPEQYIVKAPYWDAVVSGNLIVSADGTLTNPEGVGSGNPNSEIQGAYWNMPIGEGLAVNAKGDLIAAIPQFPPYYCNTDVITTTVTDFTGAWSGCNFATFPAYIDTSTGTKFNYCWYGCENLVSFPILDFTSGEDFTYSWAYSGLNSFPALDLSSGTDFYAAWYECNSLTSFPALDLSSGTDFSGSWRSCNSLTSFPAIDTGSGLYFSSAWRDCTNLTSFPLLNVSSGTDFTFAWSGCTNLTSFPLLNVSKGTSFYSAWENCTNLTSFPLLDVSSGTNFYGAWFGCNSLSSFPLLNVNSGTNFAFTWGNCSNLTSFPFLNISSGTSFFGTWGNCTSLTAFPPLDVSSGTIFYSAWEGCTSLTSFPAGMFNNCLATNFDYTWYNCALSQQSVDNILISLDVAGQENGIVSVEGGTSAEPSSTGLSAKDSLEGKGWTVLTNYRIPVSQIVWEGTNDSTISINPGGLSFTTSGISSEGYQTYSGALPAPDTTGWFLDVRVDEGFSSYVGWLGVCNTQNPITWSADRDKFTGLYWWGTMWYPPSNEVGATPLTADSYRIAMRLEGSVPKFYLKKLSEQAVFGPITVPSGTLYLMMLRQGGYTGTPMTLLNEGVIYEGGGGLF